MISTIININRQYGATYSQTVYVPKYSSGFCDCWKLKFYAALIYHQNHKEPLIYRVFRKNKGVMFHSLIPESLAPEVQAI